MALIFLSSVTTRRARSRVDIKLPVGRPALSSQSAARSGQYGSGCGGARTSHRLEARLICPACGNRRVTVVFEPPSNSLRPLADDETPGTRFPWYATGTRGMDAQILCSFIRDWHSR